MPTRVQIDGIGTVELDDAFKSKSPAEQDSIINDIVKQRGAADAPAQTAQPSLLDRAAASPLGRLAHDVVGGIVKGVFYGPDQMVKAALPLLGQPSIAPISAAIDQPYQGALARNRNTPGYADARVKADALLASHGGSGFTDQVTTAFNPTIAGTVGLFGGGLDASNAAADAQSAGQYDYRAQHPILALVGNALGGLAMGAPEASPETMAAVRSGPWLPNRPLPKLPPETQGAAEYAARQMQSAGKTPADLAAAAAGGKPITAAEAIGKPGTVGLAALARREGTTGDMLQGLLDERQAGASGRVLSDYAQASGIDPNAAHGNLEALVTAGRQKAAPLYQEALSQPPVITDRLNQFASEPIVQQGMKEGIKTERLNALAHGEPFDPNAYAVSGFDAAGDPIISGVPTWRSWDAAKVGIDDMLNQYRDKTTGRLALDKRGDAINNVRKAMLKELDGANPAYGAARAQAGDYLSAQSAFERGQKTIMDPNVTVSQFHKTLAAASPAEREAIKGGVANKMFNLAQNGRLNPRDFNRPIVQQKLSILLGEGPANKLLANVKAEAEMAVNAQRMRPGNGSQTAELGAAMADQDGSGGALGFGADIAHGAVRGRGIGRSVIDAAGQRVILPTLDAMRTRGMPVSVRDEAGRLLAGSPQDLADLLLKAGPLPQKALARPRLTARSLPPYGLFGSGLANDGRNQR
jgi:hypothetical protein